MLSSLEKSRFLKKYHEKTRKTTVKDFKWRKRYGDFSSKYFDNSSHKICGVVLTFAIFRENSKKLP